MDVVKSYTDDSIALLRFFSKKLITEFVVLQELVAKS
jgi:hypothetical protein